MDVVLSRKSSRVARPKPKLFTILKSPLTSHDPVAISSELQHNENHASSSEDMENEMNNQPLTLTDEIEESMVEMQSSDDEENQQVTCTVSDKNTKPRLKVSEQIEWKELSTGIQLHIYRALENFDSGGAFGIESLGLTATELREIQIANDRQLLLLEDEDRRITALQDDVQQLLLEDQSKFKAGMSQVLYGALFDKHFRPLLDNEEDSYNICNRADMKKAQIFLQSRGLPLFLMGSWGELTQQSASVVEPVSNMAVNERSKSAEVNLENTAKSLLETTIHQEVSSVRSLNPRHRATDRMR